MLDAEKTVIDTANLMGLNIQENSFKFVKDDSMISVFCLAVRIDIDASWKYRDTEIVAAYGTRGSYYDGIYTIAANKQ
jgi:hypothetical protein